MPQQTYDSEDGWYGILVNGELAAVQQFRREPQIFDFHLGVISADTNYEVVELNISLWRILEPAE